MPAGKEYSSTGAHGMNVGLLFTKGKETWGMKDIRVMLVDDSPFSRTLLADILQQGGCEVVGEAESIETLIQVYDECRPDIVTMDIAMPGADGFECTKTPRLHDPGARVVLVSSMKDEETEAEARRAGAVGYVQKPVDEEVILRVIRNVMSPDEMYSNLEIWSKDIFSEVLAQNITRMTKTTAEIRMQKDPEKNISQGITVVIGIIGRYPGSIVFDLALDTAENNYGKHVATPGKKSDGSGFRGCRVCQCGGRGCLFHAEQKGKIFWLAGSTAECVSGGDERNYQSHDEFAEPGGRKLILDGFV